MKEGNVTLQDKTKALVGILSTGNPHCRFPADAVIDIHPRGKCGGETRERLDPV